VREHIYSQLSLLLEVGKNDDSFDSEVGEHRESHSVTDSDRLDLITHLDRDVVSLSASFYAAIMEIGRLRSCVPVLIIGNWPRNNAIGVQMQTSYRK